MSAPTLEQAEAMVDALDDEALAHWKRLAAEHMTCDKLPLAVMGVIATALIGRIERAEKQLAEAQTRLDECRWPENPSAVLERWRGFSDEQRQRAIGPLEEFRQSSMDGAAYWKREGQPLDDPSYVYADVAIALLRAASVRP